MRVAQLNIYPVKSTRGHEIDEAEVEPWGLAHDRRWMVVDTDGDVVTAREFPRLLSVTATAREHGRLRLEGPHSGPLDVDGTTTRETTPVQVWKSKLDAVNPSAEADAWFSSLLDRDVRLVWLDEPRRRAVDPEYAKPDDRVSFADAYPLLLTTTASLRRLNDWVTAEALERGDDAPVPLPMRRFRPSVVVENDEPFAEDNWGRVRIGDVSFRAVKLCDRCVLTTIDPETLVKGKEPIRTLSRYRKWQGKVWFGMNLIPDGPGHLRVGTPVTADPK